MVRGAGCREPNPRLRRREKNVLDIPLYRPGHFTQNPCGGTMSVMGILQQSVSWPVQTSIDPVLFNELFQIFRLNVRLTGSALNWLHIADKGALT